MLPWGAPIIPDASPVQQITVPRDRNYGVRMLFLSDMLCSLGVPKSSLTRHLCINSLSHLCYDMFKMCPGTVILCTGDESGMIWASQGALLLCSPGVPKASLTRHLCIKPLSNLFYDIFRMCSRGMPESSLTRHLCIKSLSQEVG